MPSPQSCFCMNDTITTMNTSHQWQNIKIKYILIDILHSVMSAVRARYIASRYVIQNSVLSKRWQSSAGTATCSTRLTGVTSLPKPVYVQSQPLTLPDTPDCGIAVGSLPSLLSVTHHPNREQLVYIATACFFSTPRTRAGNLALSQPKSRGKMQPREFLAKALQQYRPWWTD